jgi:hypothetical protein
MGVRSFSGWANEQTFPYRAAAARRHAIRIGYIHLSLGMTPQQVIASMPEPDWAEVTDMGCAWSYAIETPGKTWTERGRFRTVSVEFGAETTVRKLESGELRWH